MGTITVKDAAGVDQVIQEPNPNGQATAANSSPVVLASDHPAIQVAGPLTDTQLRAASVAVTGPVTDTQLRAAPVPVSGPLTDTQLRATPLALPTGAAQDGTDATGVTPPTGAVGIRGWLSGIYQALQGTLQVSGPLTDAELRASSVPVLATPATSTLVDRSGTVAAATVSQVVAPANADRRGFSIQNLHATNDLWINLLSNATIDGSSIKIASGAYFETAVGGAGVAAISVLSATVSHPFSAKEW